jgi:hypothetical protein
MVAVRREFAFPIDFFTDKHWELTSSPPAVESYPKSLILSLRACRDIAQLLVSEYRAFHRELVNSRGRHDPWVFWIGDIVFASQATRSDAAHGCVGKLEYAYTGPWRITADLHGGGSYAIEHCHHLDRKDKKHASGLTPYPVSLIPFASIDSPDTQYSQLYCPNGGDHPFKEARIKGFSCPTPFQVEASFIDVGDSKDYWLP